MKRPLLMKKKLMYYTKYSSKCRIKHKKKKNRFCIKVHVFITISRFAVIRIFSMVLSISFSLKQRSSLVSDVFRQLNKNTRFQRVLSLRHQQWEVSLEVWIRNCLKNQNLFWKKFGTFGFENPNYGTPANSDLSNPTRAGGFWSTRQFHTTCN